MEAGTDKFDQFINIINLINRFVLCEIILNCVGPGTNQRLLKKL